MQVRLGVGAVVAILVSIVAVSSGVVIGLAFSNHGPANQPALVHSPRTETAARAPAEGFHASVAPETVYAATPPVAIGAVAPGDQVLVNPSTETLYSVSYAGIVTTSNALTGANPSTHYLFGSDTNRYISGAGLDPASGELFLSIITFGPASAPNYVWAINPQTFTIHANITSFHGAVDFAPTKLFYDSGSGRMLVLNYTDYAGGTMFVAVALDPNSYQVLYVWNFTCGLKVCAANNGAVTDVPNQHLFIVTADSNLTYIVNVGNFTFEILNLVGFTNSGPTAYDPATGAFLFSNLSTPSEVVEAKITSFYPFGGFAVNASAPLFNLMAISWDPVDHYFVLTGENISTTLTELIAVNATGAVLGTFLEATPVSTGYALTAAVWSNSGSETLLVSSAYTNQTCRVALASTSPVIRLVQNYTEYPYGMGGMGVDPTLGIFVELTDSPGAVRAYSATTAAPLWTDYQSGGSSAWDVAVDPALSTVYVSHGSSGLIEVLSTANGALVGALHAPQGANQLYVDPARAELFAQWYTNGSRNLTMFHLSGHGGTIGGNVTPTLTSYSGITIDSGADRVWESAYSGVAESFNETTLAYVGTLSAPGLVMYNLGSDGQGHLFIENNSNTTNEQIDIYNELSATWGPKLMLGSLAPGGFAADVADQLLWVEDGAQSVQAYNYASGALAVTATLPDQWWWSSWTDSVAWDSTSSTLAAAGGLSGVELVYAVPVPAAPGSLQATPGNATAHLAWLGSSGSGGYPVLNYSVWQSSASSGPWSSIGSSTGLTFNATGLTNGNAYYFEVEAFSGAGTSAPSNVASAIPATVPYPVPTPTAQATSSTSIAVSWTAPAANGGSAITAYDLEYATAASGPWTSITLGVVLNDTLHGLSAGTTYYLKVAAANQVGTGNYGGVASAKTSAAPATTPLNGGGTFPLVWVAVAGVAILAAIIGVVLLLRARRGRAPPSDHSDAPPTTSASPTGATSPPSNSPPSGAT
ncbi:MAG TPA: fibronectin type III domain-containing protein [Thermoplasmata archaeon]|nr:fibronectin type III domain-containing protein [Thermoplasmata archaeon]